MNDMKVKFSNSKMVNSSLGMARVCFAYTLCEGGIMALCLIGEDMPYRPLGGRRTLKEILNTCDEGVTYHWKYFEI